MCRFLVKVALTGTKSASFLRVKCWIRCSVFKDERRLFMDVQNQRSYSRLRLLTRLLVHSHVLLFLCSFLCRRCILRRYVAVCQSDDH